MQRQIVLVSFARAGFHLAGLGPIRVPDARWGADGGAIHGAPVASQANLEPAVTVALVDEEPARGQQIPITSHEPRSVW